MNNELLEKYNRPVPRYTSYPPANFFTESFTETDYRKALAESNDWEPQNISFYFHIPFCRKMCFFCGCNSFPMKKDETVKRYMEAVKKEVEMVKEYIGPGRKVSQIHYGGGTPNAIPVHYLEELNQLLFDNFSFIEQPEIAIECNPAHLDEESVKRLKGAGFRRFSIGIQDFDTNVLKAVNRDPSQLPVDELIQLLKEGDEPVDVNLDFIYGLPNQTVDSFIAAIEKAITMKPDRLVTFSYAHVPWVKKSQKRLEVIGLPSNEDKIAMFDRASELLIDSGYHAIGLDHFALANDELTIAHKERRLHRNFQGYCTRRTTGQVYAFGVSGISQLEQVYAQNSKSINDYMQQVEEGHLPIAKGYRLNDDERIVREVVTEVMCNRQLQWEDMAERCRVSQDTVRQAVHYEAAKLDELQTDGLIQFDNDKIHVTEEGNLFIRNVAATFDPLMGGDNESKFSKPV
ncbi:oxygen-independent coproporphyrinogen III oxidase [Prolixibacter denitrificans]|uniref:Coproporphyrinogen-III oxidase n=1 Tax=Prolixibacter denitrificans TaxID=1541063 RepID=A0A2P8CE24_9BACT|nr:oxygen-independent coproporphyrinogen III oxidase [Prolixibacter denitrificans]PSK83172.1 oxygen-independent coproporphyrinogen-3 oxidase [Prolixibacter denitrificans]GET21945.1 coproporphyrinogen-III oxidase [Prolixibacter denitrificans]